MAVRRRQETGKSGRKGWGSLSDYIGKILKCQYVVYGIHEPQDIDMWKVREDMRDYISLGLALGACLTAGDHPASIGAAALMIITAAAIQAAGRKA